MSRCCGWPPVGTWPPEPVAVDRWGRVRSPPRGFFADVEPVSFSLLSRSRLVPAAACWNELVFDNHVGTCNASAIADRGVLQGGLPPQVLKRDFLLQVVKGRADIAARRVTHYVRPRQRARKIFGQDAYAYVRSPWGRANTIKIRSVQVLCRGPLVCEPARADHAFAAHRK